MLSTTSCKAKVINSSVTSCGSLTSTWEQLQCYIKENQNYEAELNQNSIGKLKLSRISKDCQKESKPYEISQGEGYAVALNACKNERYKAENQTKTSSSSRSIIESKKNIWMCGINKCKTTAFNEKQYETIFGNKDFGLDVFKIMGHYTELPQIGTVRVFIAGYVEEGEVPFNYLITVPANGDIRSKDLSSDFTIDSNYTVIVTDNGKKYKYQITKDGRVNKL